MGPAEPTTHLLVVEDDPDVGRLLVDWFHRAGDVDVAWRRLADHATDQDILSATVVLADFMMPFTNGCQFLERVAELNPSARRILWTASADRARVGACEYAQVVLMKPVSMESLEDALRG